MYPTPLNVRKKNLWVNLFSFLFDWICQIEIRKQVCGYLSIIFFSSYKTTFFKGSSKTSAIIWHFFIIGIWKTQVRYNGDPNSRLPTTGNIWISDFLWSNIPKVGVSENQSSIQLAFKLGTIRWSDIFFPFWILNSSGIWIPAVVYSAVCVIHILGISRVNSKYLKLKNKNGLPFSQIDILLHMRLSDMRGT